MESNGQTYYERTYPDGKVVKAGLSESVSKSVAGLIDRINPQPILIIASCGACIFFCTNPDLRHQIASKATKLLSPDAVEGLSATPVLSATA